MPKINLPLLGDRNTVVLSRSTDIGGVRHLFGDELVVDRETALQLLEDGVGAVTHMEWASGNGLKMTGQTMQFRKK